MKRHATSRLILCCAQRMACTQVFAGVALPSLVAQSHGAEARPMDCCVPGGTRLGLGLTGTKRKSLQFGSSPRKTQQDFGMSSILSHAKNVYCGHGVRNCGCPPKAPQLNIIPWVCVNIPPQKGVGFFVWFPLKPTPKRLSSKKESNLRVGVPKWLIPVTNQGTNQGMYLKVGARQIDTF